MQWSERMIAVGSGRTSRKVAWWFSFEQRTLNVPFKYRVALLSPSNATAIRIERLFVSNQTHRDCLVQRPHVDAPSCQEGRSLPRGTRDR
jgi:hypothetical protein